MKKTKKASKKTAKKVAAKIAKTAKKPAKMKASKPSKALKSMKVSTATNSTSLWATKKKWAQIVIWGPLSIRAAVKVAAEKSGVGMSDYMRDAIVKQLKLDRAKVASDDGDGASKSVKSLKKVKAAAPKKTVKKAAVKVRPRTKRERVKLKKVSRVRAGTDVIAKAVEGGPPSTSVPVQVGDVTTDAA